MPKLQKRKPRPKKSSPRVQIQQKVIKRSLFVLLFAIVASVMLWRSFAGTEVLLSRIEIESATLPSGSSLYSDGSVSGVKMEKNGRLTYKIATTNTIKQLVLKAKGDQCNGSPKVTVTVDNVTSYTVSIGTTGWLDYGQPVNVAQGEHTISVAFINELAANKGKGKTSKCVRNVYLDKLDIYGSAPDSSAPTAPNLIATPGDRQVVLNWTASQDDIGVTRYEVWKNNGYLATLASTQLNYTATGLTNGTTYNFRVVSYDASDNFANSNTVSAVPIAAMSPPNPSDQAMPVGDIPGWRQIFTDDFTTNVPLGSFPGAVSSKWGAYPYPWRDTKGQRHSDPTLGGWYYPEKVVSINNGMMDLWLHTETIDGAQKRLVSAPQPKIKGPGTSAFAGQLYGRYAIRFRSDNLPGYKTAWLLWPDSETWPRDGEIDFPEGDLDSTINGFMHWQGGTSGSDQYYALSGKSYSDWHTAVIEWGPNRCAFYLDGALISNAYGGKSEWTTKVPNTPMHWVIQTETALEENVVPAASTQGHVQIDWVAVYAPN